MNNEANNLNSKWLALMIGNSRLHWAYFQGKKLINTKDTSHLLKPFEQLELSLNSDFFQKETFQNHQKNIPIYLASVVSQQTELWLNYPEYKIITLADIPLKNLYPTLGIDRALALWGAGITYGFPCLVIDTGTALTFTGANAQQKLVGGAILPGLRLQLQSLSLKTAALPEVKLLKSLPQRWANNTSEAIQSGIIYTLLAGIKDFIKDWLQQFPDSKIILTGGDQDLLLSSLNMSDLSYINQVIADPNLIFWGMRSLLTQIR